MKIKKGVRAFCLLLVMTLLTAMFIPAVSAISYDEMKQGSSESIAILTPDYSKTEQYLKDPLSESEISYYVFPAKWIIENNLNEDLEIVNLNLETSELNKEYDEKLEHLVYTPVQIDSDEVIYLLRLPTQMIKNQNGDDEKLDLNYPINFFGKYDNYEDMQNDILEKRKLSKLNLESSKDPNNSEKFSSVEKSKNTRSINYMESIQYDSASGYSDIDYVTGKIQPYSFTSGQSCVIYQEREIHFDRAGDLVELILWYQPDGDIYLSAAIYDETVLCWPNNEWIDASSMHQYEYYVQVNSDKYYIWFKDITTSDWDNYVYDDSNDGAEYVTHLIGTSELDLVGTPQTDFEAITNTMQDEWSQDSDDDWTRPGISFSYNSHTCPYGSGNYVYMNDWVSSNIIYTYHKAGRYQT